MLSTRLGYLRPAFLAAALAFAFCEGVRALDFFFGLGFSHTGLFAIVRLFLVVAFTGFDSGLLGFSTSLLRYVDATTLTFRVFHYVVTRLVFLEGVLYASDLLTCHA